MERQGKPPAAKARLDVLLVERGLAESLAAAQALVMAGRVVVGDQRSDKPGSLVRRDQPVRVKDRPGESARFVSRGGEKLAAALTDLGLAEVFAGAVVLDVGASTGGFTQCCLGLGAVRVLALDVGSNQLAWELRQDPRVTVLERTDIREFAPAAHPAVDVVVADVSFNSLARLAPALRRAAPRAGVHFIVLVKPQFELPRRSVPAGGVVLDPVARAAALEQVAAAFAAEGLGRGQAVDSRLSGKAGNVEIFYHVVATVAAGPGPSSPKTAVPQT